MCRSDYADRVEDSFANQIQPEQYGGNISVYIDGISVDQYKQAQQTQIGCAPVKTKSHDMFN